MLIVSRGQTEEFFCEFVCVLKDFLLTCFRDFGVRYLGPSAFLERKLTILVGVLFSSKTSNQKILYHLTASVWMTGDTKQTIIYLSPSVSLPKSKLTFLGLDSLSGKTNHKKGSR